MKRCPEIDFEATKFSLWDIFLLILVILMNGFIYINFIYNFKCVKINTEHKLNNEIKNIVN